MRPRRPPASHVLAVLIAPQQRSRGQVHAHNGARRRGTHQHAVGVGRRTARPTAHGILKDALLGDRQLLRPEQVAGGGLQRQEPDLALHFRQHVELAHQRQRRAKEERLGLRQGMLAGRSADLPLQPPRPHLVRRQSIADSRLLAPHDRLKEAPADQGLPAGILIAPCSMSISESSTRTHTARRC